MNVPSGMQHPIRPLVQELMLRIEQGAVQGLSVGHVHHNADAGWMVCHLQFDQFGMLQHR